MQILVLALVPLASVSPSNGCPPCPLYTYIGTVQYAVGDRQEPGDPPVQRARGSRAEGIGEAEADRPRDASDSGRYGREEGGGLRRRDHQGENDCFYLFIHLY